MSPPSRTCVARSTSGGGGTDSHRNLLISLAFWMCLLSAAGLYALVVLSPKMVRGEHRAEEFGVNQERLHTLRRQVDFGDRLAQELETNAAFRASLLSPPSADPSPGRRRIAVDEPLRYQGQPPPASPAEPARTIWFPMGLLQVVAASRLLQVAGLTSAAVLLVGAFTYLTDESARLPSLARLWMNPQ